MCGQNILTTNSLGIWSVESRLDTKMVGLGRYALRDTYPR